MNLRDSGSPGGLKQMPASVDETSNSWNSRIFPVSRLVGMSKMQVGGRLASGSLLVCVVAYVKMDTGGKMHKFRKRSVMEAEGHSKKGMLRCYIVPKPYAGRGALRIQSKLDPNRRFANGRCLQSYKKSPELECHVTLVARLVKKYNETKAADGV